MSVKPHLIKASSTYSRVPVFPCFMQFSVKTKHGLGTEYLGLFKAILNTDVLQSGQWEWQQLSFNHYCLFHSPTIIKEWITSEGIHESKRKSLVSNINGASTYFIQVTGSSLPYTYIHYDIYSIYVWMNDYMYGSVCLLRIKKSYHFHAAKY